MLKVLAEIQTQKAKKYKEAKESFTQSLRAGKTNIEANTWQGLEGPTKT